MRRRYSWHVHNLVSGNVGGPYCAPGVSEHQTFREAFKRLKVNNWKETLVLVVR